MGNVQTPTTQANEGLKILANRYLDVSGRPPEPKTAVAPLPTAPIDLLTNLHLPDVVKQYLEAPLTTLELQLESTDTFHKIAKKIIRHHVVRTIAGKMVLIYLDAKVVNNPESYWGQFNYFGDLFAEDYKSIFIFSDSENAGSTYKEVIAGWIEKSKFQKAEFLLSDMLEFLKSSEIKAVIGFLRDRFDLPEESKSEQDEPELSFNARLRIKLAKTFNDDDLIKLCFDLKEQHKLEYENLAGGTLDTKIMSLINHFEKQGTLPDLIAYCKGERKNESWEEFEGKSS